MNLSRLRFVVLSILLVALMLGAGAMMVSFSQSTAAHGQFQWRRSLVTAAESPIEFWFIVSLSWIFGVASLAGGPLIAWQAWRLKTPQERRDFERQFPKIYGATRPSLVWGARLIILPVAVFVLWQLIFAG